MLRSLVPNETELVRLCQNKEWNSVEHRAKSHPEEAYPSTSSLKGQRTTALAIAVRSGAPSSVVEGLVQANVHQVGVRHERRGIILQEALKHRCDAQVLRYLLRTLIHYEHVHNRATPNARPNLLATRDDLGRTALHCLAEHTLQNMRQGETSTSWVLFRSLVLACPEAVGIMDTDGNTPLTLLLLTPRETSPKHAEKQLFRMVQLLVVTYPSAATIARRLKQPWRHPHHSGCPDTNNCFTVGDGTLNPLASALLYGQKLDVIELLLDANRKVGVKACLAIISQHHEVPLHVAVSMRASPSMLSKLIHHGREAVAVCDKHGLTPLDWLWIRFVVDWCSTQHPLVNVMVSKRRFVPNQFVEWHERVTEQLGQSEALDQLGAFLREQLWERTCLLLGAYARNGNDELPAIHASCFVQCPLAMVKLAIRCNPHQLVQRANVTGRLPLHYAAARGGFTATVPVGVPHRLEQLTEKSPLDMILAEYPKATHVVDSQNQLPIHIAIESAKLFRRQKSCTNQETVADTGVTSLLSRYHDALERRDGKTMLYPFLQAAAGDGAYTNTIYALLRENPTLVTLGIPRVY